MKRAVPTPLSGYSGVTGRLLRRAGKWVATRKKQWGDRVGDVLAPAECATEQMLRVC